MQVSIYRRFLVGMIAKTVLKEAQVNSQSELGMLVKVLHPGHQKGHPESDGQFHGHVH